MQYAEQVRGTPFKIEELIVDDSIVLTEEGNVVITEQKKVHLTKQEFLKSIKSMSDRLGYLNYQISEDNINRIQQQINDLKKKKELLENFYKIIK